MVEDESIVARDILAQLLELGYDHVGHATTGVQAISLAGELRPDLVLMDIQLAGAMDGIVAAQEIRIQFALPVVFVSAFAADDVLARAKLTEPYGYILKPFSQRDLHTVIEMALYKYQADLKSHEAAQHTQAILDNMADGVITINAHGLIESFNKAACSIFDYEFHEVVGRNVSMLMHADAEQQHDGYLQRYRDTGEARVVGVRREFLGRCKDGRVFPMSLAVSKINRAGQATFIGLVRDLTQHHLDLEKIERLAFYDPLTFLPNRRLLMDRLDQAMHNSVRTGKHGGVIFLDMDNFKLLNDTLGHDVGDMLLGQVATRLGSCVRDGDSIARFGGDEFVVLLEALSVHEPDAAAQAKTVALKILDTLGQAYNLGDTTYSSSPSIGIVLFMQDKESVDDVIKKADVAMYQAKTAGRNTIRFFDPKMQALVTANLALEKDLRDGLSNREFLLHYQIQVKDGLRHHDRTMITGVEALVRWNHPRRGMVSPAQFIPLAENTGLILSLGQWVLESACAQLLAWASNPKTAHWTMAVNVSALQFSQADFVTNVEQALQKSGANPNLLKLELTESMLVENVDEIVVKMNAIKAHGVSFSLDDFGTGYSSLSFLKRLPLTQLKIDQSFVRDILTDTSDAVIAHTIVALAHNLGLRVIAEGVETEAQRDALAKMGCNAYQGYLFGRPACASTLEDEL